ncbi:MAG: FAD-dependent oxidoreductase [Dehalococcoidia bacterium]|nr:MAG: FAD-dependent oxidoreductase [Dehalococcoidia bacterium]
MAKLENLFTPIKIAEVELKNRIVMLALTTGYNEPDNTVGDRIINFYAERAKGGVGLIIVPFTAVDIASPAQPGLFHDRFIPGARRLADAVHTHGAKIAAQLLTQYHWATSEGGSPEVVGPSPVFNQMMRCTPKALTIEEIHRLVEEHAKAAWRAREAGFDAVELPIVGGYLLNRFLSPHSNKREDEYGGSLENRLRLPLEIIEAIKQTAGEDYAIICRLNVEEFMEGGHSIEDSKKVAAVLEASGVKAMNVYVGWHECAVPTVQMSVPRGAFVYLAEDIKKVVNIPVIAANRINDAILAEKILSEGKADLVGMARALLADPELPNKAREGKIDEIVPCIACSYCLAEILSAYKEWKKPVSTFCVVNPRAGRELEYAIKPATISKRVFVVGGGPGGMETAIVAASRGHQVTLCEKGDRLGGQLLTASLPPHKDEISTLIQSLSVRTQKAGVEVKLSTEVDLKTIEQGKPDVVVLATGATPIIPDIPGARGKNVVPAVAALTGQKELGEIVIVVGGGMVGCETAEFLAQEGKKVSIVEMLPRIGNDIVATNRPFTLARLRKAGIRMDTNAKVEEITNKGVTVSRDGVSDFLEGDTVVLAVGFTANKELFQELEGRVAASYSIGDCVEARMMRQAVEEGFCLGMEI